MTRPIQLVIDPDAMARNLETARTYAPAAKIWAVAKANAYGHGIDNAVIGFKAADGLAVLDLHEAQQARAAGWLKPILLMAGVF
jgi:alanine racemase